MADEKKEKEITLTQEEAEALGNLLQEAVRSMEEAQRVKEEKEKKEEEEKKSPEKVVEEVIPEKLKLLLDIPIQIQVELGRKKMLLGELLQVSQGSIIQLDKNEDQPVDIYANGKLIARGEVIVINDRFGVRIIDIVTPEERVKILGGGGE